MSFVCIEYEVIYIYDFEFLFREKIMNKSKILFTIFYIEDELIDIFVLFVSFKYNT